MRNIQITFEPMMRVFLEVLFRQKHWTIEPNKQFNILARGLFAFVIFYVCFECYFVPMGLQILAICLCNIEHIAIEELMAIITKSTFYLLFSLLEFDLFKKDLKNMCDLWLLRKLTHQLIFDAGKKVKVWIQ